MAEDILRDAIIENNKRMWLEQHIGHDAEGNVKLGYFKGPLPKGTTWTETGLFDFQELFRGETNEPDIKESDHSLSIPWRNRGGNVARSGSLGNNMGAISSQTPYLIVNRPRLSVPDNYGHYHGYPSNMTRRLGSLNGFTKVGDIHLENIPGTSNELDLISSYLHGGVIINNVSHSEPSVFTLYRNNSDLNTINKSLTTLATCAEIKLKEPTDVVSPTFVLSGMNTSEIIGCNYIYYPAFQRYYFIRNKKSVHTDVWELQCEVDAIETFRYDILNLEAVIERQENVYNLYLDDGTLKAYSDPVVQAFNFPHNFNEFGTEYIMVAVGQ